MSLPRASSLDCMQDAWQAFWDVDGRNGRWASREDTSLFNESKSNPRLPLRHVTRGVLQ